MKGHALLSTLIVALLINIILTGVLLTYLNSISLYQVIERKQIARSNFFSGVDILLGDTSTSKKAHNTTILFTDNPNDSVNITKELWGIFWLGIVKGYSKNEKNEAAFLYGSSPEAFTALILADHQRPLNLAGTSFINGDVALPVAGISAVNLEGKKFEGHQLFSGSKKISKEEDFYEDSSIINGLQILMNKTKSLENIRKTGIRLNQKYSFISDTITYIGLQREAKLQNCFLEGKAIFLSDSIVEVDSSSYIKDCIIIAPEIRIKQGFKGSLQVIANKIIEVESRVNLQYPSSLVVLNSEEENYPRKIIIKPNSNIEGVIAILGNNTGFKPLFSLSEKSIFKGTCYVRGFSEIKGSLIGTLTTDYFIFRSSFATYENVLVDAKIDRLALSEFFVGSPLVKSKTSFKVIKWLN